MSLWIPWPRWLAAVSKGLGLVAAGPDRTTEQIPRGLSGLIASFQQGGLGEIVASWIGKGQNLPVSADQLGRVLDPGVVNELAAKTGQDTGSVLGSLSALLPQLVDKATPEGAVEPGQSFNPTDLLASLSGLFGNRG